MLSSGLSMLGAATAQAQEFASQGKDMALQMYYSSVDTYLEKLEGKQLSHDDPLFKDFVHAVAMAAQIYNFETMLTTFSSSTRVAILSIEIFISTDQSGAMPDVIATYDPQDADRTVWVTCRGTANMVDAIADLAWLASIKPYANFYLPFVPAQRASSSCDKLHLFLADLEKEFGAKGPKRVAFCGHSLGGAVAGITCMKYVMDTGAAKLDFVCITLAAPHYLPHDPSLPEKIVLPEHLQWDNKSTKVLTSKFTDKVHNFVQRLDLIPRMVGPHEVPDVVMQGLDKVGIKAILDKFSVKRNKFRVVGSNYIINPPHGKRSESIVLKVTDPKAMLASFPDTLLHVAMALANDHNSDTSKDTLRGLCKHNDGNFQMMPDPEGKCLPWMDIVLYQQGSKGIVVASKAKPPSVAAALSKEEQAENNKLAAPSPYQATAKVSSLDIEMGNVPIVASQVMSAMPVVAAQVMDRTSAAGTEDRMPTPNTIDYDPGLTANVIGLSETPSMFLDRVLGDGEHVLATFDVKFPGEFIPLWKIVALCIVTLGMYSIVLFFRWVRRCCYRNKCCIPALVSFSFGKMAITNRGRVICWEENIEQVKPKQTECPESCVGTPCLCYIDGLMLRCACFLPAMCCRCDKLIFRMLWCPLKMCVTCCCPDTCAPPVTYKTVNFSRIYRTSDIRQITQYFTSEASCVFCCLDYSSGVEVAFNSFNHGANHLQIASRSLVSEDHFGQSADAAASSSSLGAYWSWARSTYDRVTEVVDVVEGAFGGTSNLKVLKIISNTGDVVHNGNVDSVLRDLALLHKKVLDCLPELPDAIVPSDVDAKGIKLAMEGGYNGETAKNKKVEFTDWFKMVQVVKNDGSVQLPRDWVPLVRDEEIIAVSGQVGRMGCMEWFWTYLTCGVSYCLHYRRRKYTRSALILTNKRLITMDLYERSGSIPASLSNFSVQVRSYILEKVSSGYIRSHGDGHLESGIETTAGAICVHFNTNTKDGGEGGGGTGRLGMSFALAMQMSVERLKSKVNMDHMINSKVASDRSTDYDLLPLMGQSEKVVDWIKGEKIWEPFGAVGEKSFCNSCRSYYTYSCCCGEIHRCDPVDNCCSRESLDNNKVCGSKPPGCMFPIVPYMLTCALYPFQTRRDVIVTDMSMIRFARTQNYGLCGCLRFLGICKVGPCMTMGAYIISWEPLEAFSGFTMRIDSHGEENVKRRICKGNCIGRNFCPIGSSTLEIGLDFKGKYQFCALRGGQGGSNSDANKVWLKDPDLALNTKMLAGVQFALYDKMGKTAGSAARDPKKKWTFF